MQIRSGLTSASTAGSDFSAQTAVETIASQQSFT